MEQDLVMFPVQHIIAPPGRLSQPNPPHAPQVAGQHFMPEESGMLPWGHFPEAGGLFVGGGVGGVWPPEIMHGGLAMEHELVTLPVQHLTSPPGRLSHPAPPHCPQVEGQQYLPVESEMLSLGHLSIGGIGGGGML